MGIRAVWVQAEEQRRLRVSTEVVNEAGVFEEGSRCDKVRPEEQFGQGWSSVCELATFGVVVVSHYKFRIIPVVLSEGSILQRTELLVQIVLDLFFEVVCAYIHYYLNDIEFEPVFYLNC